MKKRMLLTAVCFLGIVLTAMFLAAGRAEAVRPFEERYKRMSWGRIVEEARGQTVYWYMWGGSDTINKWVTGYIGRRLKDEYGVTLKMVPVTDAPTFVNKVLGEKQAGKTRNGSVDIMWINGENFRTMKRAGLLFGPYSDKLPNTRYVDMDAPSIANDFGFPVEGYESPYGSAQVVMIYDKARVPEPPTTISGLIDWIRENPGKFTYPAIPDFTGSGFVRHIFYHAAGGYEQLLGPFDQATFDRVAPKAWKILNGIEPYLWRKGKTYPENHQKLQGLFSNGAVYFDMDYNPNTAANLVAHGRYPESVRTFVFDSGTIGNTHYVAISFNSGAKAGAMVLANLLLDPAAQFEKAKPEVWGDLTTLDISRLSAEWQEKFNRLPRPLSVLPAGLLSSHKIPELQAEWLEAIEKGWVANVLQK